VKHFSRVLLLIFLLAPALASGQVGVQDDAKIAMFQQLYSDIRSAFDTRDPQHIGDVLAPDFVSVDISGVETDRQATINSIAALPAPSLSQQRHTTILSVTEHAGQYVVEQQYERISTQVSDDGSSHTMRLLTKSSDVWAHFGERLLTTRTQTDEVSVFIDNQLVAHQQRTVGS
jgi:hypothetical protein